MITNIILQMVLNVYVSIASIISSIDSHSWLYNNMWLTFAICSVIKFFQLLFFKTTFYLQVYEWFSIVFVIRYESRIAVKSLIYKNYDRTLSKFTLKELKIRNIFIFVYLLLVFIFAIKYIYSIVKTTLLNMGYSLQSVEGPLGATIRFNQHVLSLELAYNDYIGFDFISDIAIVLMQDIPSIITFGYMIMYMRQNQNYTYL